MKIIEYDSHKVVITAIGEGSAEQLTATDRAHIESLTATARKAEQVAWRTGLRGVLGNSVEVAYQPSGAPILIGSEWQISVSHNSQWAVVAIGRHRCGVDVESLNRNYERIASRYISPTEDRLPESNNPLFRPLIWSAKEAIYKFVATEGVDFLRDIIVTATDIANGRLQAEFRGEKLPEMEFIVIEDSSVLCLIREKE